MSHSANILKIAPLFDAATLAYMSLCRPTVQRKCQSDEILTPLPRKSLCSHYYTLPSSSAIAFIDAAHIVCGAGFTKRSGVRPSVRLSVSTAAMAVGGFAAERHASRSHRSKAAGALWVLRARCRRRHTAANAGSATLSADGGG